jgi:hypothetical protein
VDRPSDLRQDLAAATAEITTLLTSESFGQAGPRIQAARALWPNDLRLLLCEGEWLEKTTNPDAAAHRYREAAARHPDNPWPWVRLTDLLLGQGRFDEARVVFGDHVWSGGTPEAVRTRLLSRVTAATAPSSRADYLGGLLQGSADDRFVLVKLAALRFRERDRGEAKRLLEAARSLGPLPPESQLIELDLLLMAARFDEAFALAMSLREAHPRRPDFVRRAIQAAHLSGRSREMVELLFAALTQSPTDWLLVFRYNRCTCPMAADRTLFEVLEKHELEGLADDRWLFQYVLACLRHGHTARAIDLLNRLTPACTVASMAMPLLAALAAHPVQVWRSPRGISNDPAHDVQIRKADGAAGTIIVFAGVQGGLGYLPFALVDGLLSRLPVNVVYLRDLGNRGFTAGVSSLGPDGAAMASGLRRIAHEIGGQKVVCIGASLGGLAAVRAAIQMDAHAAISFAGPTIYGQEPSDAEADLGGGRSMRDTIFSALTRTETSVRDMIRRGVGTLVFQCYGAQYAPDVANAQALVGLPNVELVTIRDCADHFVVHHMIAGTEFDDLLYRVLQRPSASTGLPRVS